MDNMDLRRTRTFVTVAELGTVSKAALRLHIAQPALSRQISDLEEELGLKLFDRVGRRLVLSSAGEQLLGDCRGLLEYARAIGEHAQRLQRGDSGVLKVSASPHLIEGIFPEFLQRYAKRFPNVEVKLIDTVGPEVLAMLERGEIDLAQTLESAIRLEDKRFVSHPIESTDMLAASHPGLNLGKGVTIEIARLAPYPLLQISSEFVIRTTFDAACRLAGFKPNIVLECGAPHALLAMAEAGHGIAIIPSALRTDHYRLRMMRVTYQGKPLNHPLTILSNKRRPLPPYAVAFCEMLAEYVRKVFPITRPSARTALRGAKRAPVRRG
jgi:DNA-binding transcriptional LysR family regulator